MRQHMNCEHEWIQLERQGVPLEPTRYRARPKYELVIRQARSGPNTLFEDKFGHVRCGIGLHIVSKLPGKTLLLEAHLEVPSVSSHFTWLSGTDQMGNALQCYSFYDDDWLGPFSREGVINHHLGGRSALQRGGVLSGLLLGSASLSDSLPGRFPHGCTVGAELTLWDQFDHDHSIELRLRVERAASLVEKLGIPKARRVSPLGGKRLNVERQKLDCIGSRDKVSASTFVMADLSTSFAAGRSNKE